MKCSSLNRRDELDFLKGFGILLMIMGHVPINHYAVHYIYIFHMPLFFWVSGILYRDKEQPLNQIILKYARKLFHPYLFFAMLGSILLLLETKMDFLECVKRIAYSVFFINTDGMPIAGALWYLTAIFFVYVFFIVLKKYVKRRFLQNLCIWGVFAIGLFWKRVFDFRLPWAVDVAFVGIGFYYGGYLCSVYKECLKKLLNKNGLLVVLFVLCSFGGMLNEKVSMRICEYGNGPCFAVCAFGLVLVFYRIACEICKRRVPTTIIRRIGQRSIFYLCMNEIVINVTNSVLSKLCEGGALLVVAKFFVSLFVLIFAESFVYRFSEVKKIVGV